MDAILKLSPKERGELFIAANQRTGMDAVILEKDFWVCWTLQELFGLPGIGPNLLFKGGTSLSKVFEVIRRFSEDIDVSLSRDFLGFGGPKEPESGGSRKEQQRRVEALKTACQQKIARELAPALEAVIRSKLDCKEAWSLVQDAEDPDLQTLLFVYPSSLPDTDAAYIRRFVKIEMGARADHWPSESATITPYIAAAFPGKIAHPTCRVTVLSVERTFWEKATILQSEFHRPPDKAIPDRLSRHYCDVYEMIRKGVAKSAEAKPDLLARVAQHKALFFRSSWAHYEGAAKGTLRIIPPEPRWKALREDYGKMQQMFFDEPPEFETMMAALREWEQEFNRT